MVETKLNQNNPQHRLLIALMASFVDDFGYHPRELFELMDHSKKELYFGLQEIYLEGNKND